MWHTSCAPPYILAQIRFRFVVAQFVFSHSYQLARHKTNRAVFQPGRSHVLYSNSGTSSLCYAFGGLPTHRSMEQLSINRSIKAFTIRTAGPTECGEFDEGSVDHRPGCVSGVRPVRKLLPLHYGIQPRVTGQKVAPILHQHPR